MPQPKIKMELTLVCHLDPDQLPKSVTRVLSEIEREKDESDHSWAIRQRDHLVSYLNKIGPNLELAFFTDDLYDAADHRERRVIFRGRD